MLCMSCINAIVVYNFLMVWCDYKLYVITWLASKRKLFTLKTKNPERPENSDAWMYAWQAQAVCDIL